uniref:Uncharacterized protein n=1 Tax=Hyaloperonospora arabidopsidis (strain Emoy2) TaxID=559515 RepID=M4BR12_HYAAE
MLSVPTVNALGQTDKGLKPSGPSSSKCRGSRLGIKFTRARVGSKTHGALCTRGTHRKTARATVTTGSMLSFGPAIQKTRMRSFWQ